MQYIEITFIQFLLLTVLGLSWDSYLHILLPQQISTFQVRTNSSHVLLGSFCALFNLALCHDIKVNNTCIVSYHRLRTRGYIRFYVEVNKYLPNFPKTSANCSSMYPAYTCGLMKRSLLD